MGVLTIYRRHLRGCLFYNKRHQRTARANAARKNAPSGSRGRSAASASDVPSICVRGTPRPILIHQWNASGQIGVKRVIAPPIVEAVSRFLADATSRGIRPSSLKKYGRLLEGEFVPFCQSRNVARLDRVTVDFLRTFRQSLTHAPITQQKKIEYLRAFMRFCVEADWISKNPAKAVKLARVRYEPTLPFSVDEVQRLLGACATFRGNGPRLHAMIRLLRHSGLRIGDAVSLARDRITDDNLFLYTAKTGTPVRCPLPGDLVRALAALPGERFFWNGKGTLKTTLEHWRRAFVALAAEANVPNAHFHRLRDTFAVALLGKGVSIEQVAMLLGNTPAIVLKHYAPWVKERQLQLDAAVRKTWTAA
jgi:integrase/recombinase XerD